MGFVAHYAPYYRLLWLYTLFRKLITNYVRQPWPFSVTWRHRTRDIRFAIRHFRLVVLWNQAPIYIGLCKYWALSILQYPRPLAKVIIFNQRGPRPKKVTEGPGWLRYATEVYLHSFSRGCLPKSRKRAKFRQNLTLQQFKVIQGHRSWCQSKAHVRLPISH